MKIFRVWAETDRTPNPIQETCLDEETIAQIVENGFNVNYFFMED